MNRTALCIRMLALLKVRGRMRIDEIAEALETNPRNVREFRKELEIAGYPIIQTTGRYGGYQLDNVLRFCLRRRWMPRRRTRFKKPAAICAHMRTLSRGRHLSARWARS